VVVAAALAGGNPSLLTHDWTKTHDQNGAARAIAIFSTLC
jgi:hypothetical protein